MNPSTSFDNVGGPHSSVGQPMQQQQHLVGGDPAGAGSVGGSFAVSSDVNPIRSTFESPPHHGFPGAAGGARPSMFPYDHPHDGSPAAMPPWPQGIPSLAGFNPRLMPPHGGFPGGPGFPSNQELQFMMMNNMNMPMMPFPNGPLPNFGMMSPEDSAAAATTYHQYMDAMTALQQAQRQRMQSPQPEHQLQQQHHQVQQQQPHPQLQLPQQQSAFQPLSQAQPPSPTPTAASTLKQSSKKDKDKVTPKTSRKRKADKSDDDKRAKKKRRKSGEHKPHKHHKHHKAKDKKSPKGKDKDRHKEKGEKDKKEKDKHKHKKHKHKKQHQPKQEPQQPQLHASLPKKKSKAGSATPMVSRIHSLPEPMPLGDAWPQFPDDPRFVDPDRLKRFEAEYPDSSSLFRLMLAQRSDVEALGMKVNVQANLVENVIGPIPAERPEFEAGRICDSTLDGAIVADLAESNLISLGREQFELQQFLVRSRREGNDALDRITQLREALAHQYEAIEALERQSQILDTKLERLNPMQMELAQNFSAMQNFMTQTCGGLR